MQYDQENDRIKSGTKEDILIYPDGITFQTSTAIEITESGDSGSGCGFSISVTQDDLDDLILGLIEARHRMGAETELELIEWRPATEPPDGDDLIFVDAEDRDEPVIGYWEGDRYVDEYGNAINFPKAWTDFPQGYRRHATNE